MRKETHFWSAVLACAVVLGIFLVCRSLAGQSTAEAETAQTQTLQIEKNPEKIVPSPRNIRESTGVYVFLAWIWLAISVLVFVLNAKIREADRLFGLKFFPEKKD